MIDKNTLVYEALEKKPGCEEVFFKFGMHCLGCPMSRGENIGQAAASHGLDLEQLLKELNAFKAK